MSKKKVSALPKKSDIHNKIIDFFTKNPNPVDSEIHALSGKLKMNTHKLETQIYRVLTDYIKNSIRIEDLKHAGDPDSDFDAAELKAGTKVETEHLDNREAAKAVAKAHLAEFPDYYTRLKAMEDQVKASK